MSRVGLSPITIPQGVEVNIDGNKVTVKKDKNELSRSFSDITPVEIKEDQLIVSRVNNNGTSRAMHGLTRALLANMVEGVNKGFVRTLEVRGVGYNARMNGEKLMLQVGFSHVVEISLPAGLQARVEGNNRIHIQGIDKEAVGEMAAKIRAIKPADAYKGKGIKYLEEVLHLKPGKAGKASKS